MLFEKIPVKIRAQMVKTAASNTRAIKHGKMMAGSVLKKTTNKTELNDETACNKNERFRLTEEEETRT